jgi:K+/H+ antiporter YhaU regulatory subunit KhtT
VVGQSVAQSRFRDNYYCMIVKIMDSEGEYADPDANRVLQSGDTLWVVGDSRQIEKMK